jgi:hypothetical protein
VLKNDSAHLSPEQALEEWREQHPEGVEFEDDTEAIQAALDDMANGDTGRDFDEVMAEIRAKYGLPKRLQTWKFTNLKGMLMNIDLRRRTDEVLARLTQLRDSL